MLYLCLTHKGFSSDQLFNKIYIQDYFMSIFGNV